MRFWVVHFFMGFAASGVAGEPGRPTVIYGEDNRQDLFEVADPLLIQRARGTAAIFHSGSIAPTSSGDFYVQTYQYGPSARLCAEERFYAQPAAALCTGFLVGPDLLATAGHCVRDAEECAKRKIVFNFAYSRPDRNVNFTSRDDVYACRSIVNRRFTKSGADYALIRLDRPVEGGFPLPLNRAGLKVDSEYAVIGYPNGLPLKVAAGAFFRKAKKSFFKINSDTAVGNSGSPVINLDTGLVEGILVRGERDFVWDSRAKCFTAKRCAANRCRGESVTYSSVFSDQVPGRGGEPTSLPESFPLSAATPPLPE